MSLGPESILVYYYREKQNQLGLIIKLKGIQAELVRAPWKRQIGIHLEQHHLNEEAEVISFEGGRRVHKSRNAGSLSLEEIRK